MSNPEWAELAQRLQEPFDPQLVEFRPQGSLTDKGRGRAIAYVDARVVAERLDHIFGPLGWGFSWEPLILDNAVRVVKGTITINGVSKSDIGDGDKTEPSKAAVSDALKRTAVLLGVGRYLYTLEAEWVDGKPAGSSWFIPDAELARLRAKLPRPLGYIDPAPNRPPAQASAPVESRAGAGAQGRVFPLNNGAASLTRAAEASTHENSDPAAHLATAEQIARIRALAAPAGKTVDGLCADLRVVTLGNLSSERAEKLIARLQELADARAQAVGA